MGNIISAPADTGEQLLQHGIHGRVKLRGIRVDIVAGVMRVHEHGDGGASPGFEKVRRFLVGGELRGVIGSEVQLFQHGVPVREGHGGVSVVVSGAEVLEPPPGVLRPRADIPEALGMRSMIVRRSLIGVGAGL